MKNEATLYLQEQHNVECGSKHIQYFIATFLIKPYSIDPTEGDIHDYNNCDSCKNVRNAITELLKKKYEKFPFCCKWHQNLLNIKEFNKLDYINGPQMSADKVIYCYQHILNNQDKDNWKQDITNYLEYAIESFGNFPEGCGIPLFLQEFIEQLLYRIENNKDIKCDVKQYIKLYFDDFMRPAASNKKINPFNLLISKYNVWLKLFPFDFPEFKDAKKHFEQQTPFFIESVTYNPYSKLSKGTLITENRLVNYLGDLTYQLLKKIDFTDLSKNKELNDYYSIIIDSEYRIENKKLFASFSNNELKYIDFIKRWLEVQKKYFQQTKELFNLNHQLKGDVYNDSYNEALERISYFKKFIEDKDGYILSWQQDKVREKDVQISFKAVWYNTAFDVNREVGNGRGFVDYTISKGVDDKTLVEFKLASNSKIKSNLQHQLPIYAKANDTEKCISVIMVFTDKENKRLNKILKELNLEKASNIIVIDARYNNKISASNI